MVFSPSTFMVTDGRRAAGSLARPPPDRGDISDVRWDHSRAVPVVRRAKGVKKLGLDYEQRVADVLSAIYTKRFVRSPRILYRRYGYLACAIPDGILYLDGVPVIIEVKLAHTETVWEQLIERYLPLVERLHPRTPVRAVEIARSYDPAVPVAHTFITSLHETTRRAAARELEVMRWRI